MRPPSGGAVDYQSVGHDTWKRPPPVETPEDELMRRFGSRA